MREVTAHKIGSFNKDQVAIFADEPDHPSVTPHKYKIRLKGLDGQYADHTKLVFQKGPTSETSAAGETIRHAANGVSLESLLAVCLDRIQHSGRTGFGSSWGKAADRIQEAILWLSLDEGAEGKL